MIYGTDVSSHQPEHFPLELPDGKPLDFVMIKATQGGGYTNPKWEAQAAWAREHGLAVGFYHFLTSGSVPGQAARFVGAVSVLWPGETLWVDWEGDPGGVAATSEEKDQFIREVKRLLPGRKVGLYCNVDYWKNRDRSDYFGDALWIANWAPGDPPIEAKWSVHQYRTESGMDWNRARFDHREDMKVWGGKPPSDIELVARGVASLQDEVRAVKALLLAVSGAEQARYDTIKESMERLWSALQASGPSVQAIADGVIRNLADRLES